MVQLATRHVVTLLATLAATAAGNSATGPKRPSAKPARLSMEEFPWTNPFASPEMALFTPACEARKTFKASEFLLDDLQVPPPKGVRPYGDALRTVFSGRSYPGSWDGIDPHGYDRTFLQMEYANVPLVVREWIENHERQSDHGKGLFAVFEKPSEGEKATATFTPPAPQETSGDYRNMDETKVVLFAPGALYSILPLWASEGSSCELTLGDWARYDAKFADGGIVSWVTEHSRPKRTEGEREMEFTIVAQVLKEVAADEAKPSASASINEVGQDKDEL